MKLDQTSLKLSLLATGLICVIAWLAVPRAGWAADEPHISGLYEICIGVTDLLPQIAYWEQFGYRIGKIGELSAAEAKALYGVESKLRSVRLLHQDADHGLIRLLVWEKPLNEGLGLARLMTPGSRWTSTLTRDVLQLYNHAEAAQRAGKPVNIVSPQWSEIYKLEQSEPFLGNIVGVRELIVLQPLTRNMFFERFGYDAPRYGKISESSKFRSSQVTHSGLVYQSDDSNLPLFYRDVLGLQVGFPEMEYRYQSLDAASRSLYGMKPGEYYFGATLDDPRSGVTPDTAISGRVLLRRIPTEIKVENLMAHSRPGSLGYSLYTYRVRELAQMHAKVKASKATDVTAALHNEFGEQSFSFKAPDGHSWTLLGK
jgi:hypothetical protein